MTESTNGPIMNATVIDSFATIPEFARLRRAVDGRSWGQLEVELSGMSADQASVALATIAELERIEGFLEGAVLEHPHSAFASTALAARYIALAWAARSRHDAHQVSPGQFMSFFEWLTEAERLLLAVFDEHPRFAPAWSAGLTTARGLQLGTDEVQRRYQRLVEFSPHDYPAQVQLLQFVLPKWFGTWEEAGAFARDAAQAAPRGSNSGALVALLHIEKWADLEGGEAGLAHLKQREVIRELREAAARSVLHGEGPLDPVRVEAHNTFAMVFWLGGHYADAAPHFEVLNGRASEFPWRYTAGTSETIEEIRRYVLTKRKGWFGRRARS